MAQCKKIRKPHRKVCVGDMDDVVVFQFRNISAPIFNTVDFTEDFTNMDEESPDSFALITTPNGKTWFDGVATEFKVTHEIYVPFDERITSEIWLTIEGESEDHRVDILSVNDLENRHEIMLLTCNDQGLVNRDATQK
jgi:hypothetical protein